MDGAFAAGIFASESGQRLLQIILQMADRGFQGLYDKCQPLLGQYYLQGLQRVHAWSDAVILEDVQYVRGTCPIWRIRWRPASTRYVQDRFRGRGAGRCPSIMAFTRSFLEHLGQHESIVSGEYFRRGDTMLKRVACMDAARQALYSLYTNVSARVETASEVGVSPVLLDSASSAQRAPSAVSQGRADSTFPPPPPPPRSLRDTEYEPPRQEDVRSRYPVLPVLLE